MEQHGQPDIRIKWAIGFLFLFGFTATALQIVYLRAFLSLFYGNELSIGLFLFSWMLWTAAGSFLFGKIQEPQNYLHVHLFLFSLIIPVTSLALQYLRLKVQPLVGTLPDLISTLQTAFLGLILFGLFSGGLFPLYTRLLRQTQRQTTEHSGSTVYLWETIGSAFSGLLAGLVLIRFFEARQLIIAFALLNFLISLYFLRKFVKRQGTFSALLFTFVFISELIMFLQSDARLNAKLWDGLNVVEHRSSLYGALTLTSLGKSYTLYQNGVPVFTIPDQQTAEETVHYAMLLHHRPQNVLLIGGGFSGALFEILKYRSLVSLDYVELDPEIVALYRTHFPVLWDSLQKDGRVHFHLTDGRLFLQNTKNTFDVIIAALPDPFTVQLNRFYTKEFFQLVRQRLNQNGIFAFNITGSANFIDQNHARYIQCIHHSFQPFFKQFAVLPGNKIYFFLSNRADPLPLTSHYIKTQLQKRGILTQYVQDYYVSFKLMPDRVDQLRTVLKNFDFPKANEDFRPMAFFFDMILWTSKFSSSISARIAKLIFFLFSKFLIGFFLLLFVWPFVLVLKEGQQRLAMFAPLAMSVVGFSIMTLELMLLMAFQIEFGYIYYRIALFIAFFMLGMAVGCRIALQSMEKIHSKSILSRVLAIHLGLILLAVLLVPLLRLQSIALVFWFLALLSGALGGLAFPLLSFLFFQDSSRAERNSGALYAWDLIGSLFGSLLSSMVIIPIYGLPLTGRFLALLNLFVLLWLLLAYYRSPDKA